MTMAGIGAMGHVFQATEVNATGDSFYTISISMGLIPMSDMLLCYRVQTTRFDDDDDG